MGGQIGVGENSGSRNADGKRHETRTKNGRKHNGVGGTRVIQIMNPGFIGDFVGRRKAWTTGSRIPGKRRTIFEAMYTKKCHDSHTQISSERTARNLLQKSK